MLNIYKEYCNISYKGGTTEEMQEVLISTVDFGSKKISASAGKSSDGEFDIIGTKCIPSDGIEKGFIVDIDKCKESFKEVMEKLKLQTNENLKDIYVGISSKGLRITEANVKITLNNGKVRGKDIKRALNKCKFNVELLEGEEVVDTIINYYMVDDKIVYDDVVGWIGNSLSIDASVIIGPSEELLKFTEVVNDSGYNFKGFIVNIIAGRNIFIQGKKFMGVKVLVDVGASTTDVSIFRNGVLKYIGNIPLGGNNLTRDLSICGEFSMTEAERIKTILSSNFETLYKDDTVEDIIDIGSSKISKTLYYEVINARLEEVLNYINEEIKNTSFCEGMCSIIIYGNGITYYENIVELVKNNIDFNTIIANSDYLGMKKTSNITSLSVVKEVFDRFFLFESESKEELKETETKVEVKDEEIIENEIKETKSGLIGKLKRFIREII